MPSHDKEKAARQFALSSGGLDARFAAVRVDQPLTLVFADSEDFDRHHLSFHVSEPQFSGIFGRIKSKGVIDASTPWSHDDGSISERDGGRSVGLVTRDGHPFELSTVTP